MPKYEAVLTVQTKEGPVAPGDTVELSKEEGELFLARGFIREAEGGSDEPDDDLTVADEVTRELLRGAGFGTDDEVRRATDEVLLDVEDIGPKRLEKIRETAPYSGPSEPTEA